MRGRLIAAAVLEVAGLVWVGQGLGLLRGSSPMVDDLRWAAAAAVAIVIGLALAISARRSTRPRP
ncbi:MAG: hypothetical protein M3P84_10695 [Chloroflexota bacterium]|nr:hypothetical protein [Chloroflexota bacterium]